MTDPSSSDPSGFPSVPDAPSGSPGPSLPPTAPPAAVPGTMPPTPGAAVPPAGTPGGMPPAPGTMPPAPPAPDGGMPPAPGTMPPTPAPGSQPPPPMPGTQPPPPGFGAPGFGPAPAPEKGPRPQSKLGAILMIAGAAIAMLAVFLPWASEGGQSLNGLDDFFWLDGFTLYDVSSPGMFVLIGGAIMLGLGITTLVAGRILAIAIIGIVSGALGIVGGLIELGLVASFADSTGASISIGVILQPIAPILSLVGAIIVTATRRKAV